MTKCCDITFSPWNQKTYLCPGEAINLQVSFKGETFFLLSESPAVNLLIQKDTSIVVDPWPLWKSVLALPAAPLLLRWRSPRAQVRDGAMRAG